MKIRNSVKLILITAFILSATIASSTRAALSGDAVDDLKKNASEKLQIEIIKVEQIQSKRSRKGYMNLRYTAKVTKVDRSKTGVKVGAEITIDAYHWTVDFVGPANPPLLKKGWKGGVLLNPVDATKDQFKLAAYGHSFY